MTWSFLRPVLYSLTGVAVVGLMTAAPVTAAEKPIRINMTSQYMDSHKIVTEVYKPWMEDVKKRTNGRVLITYFNPNTVCAEGEILDATAKGAQVQIGSHIVSRNAGKALLNAVQSPMITSNALAASMTYWRLYNENSELQKEFDGIKMLWVHTSAPAHVHTTKKTIKTLEDMKNLKIIGPSGLSLIMLRAFGSNPVQVPGQDMYMSLQRNMAEGVFFPIAPLRSFKINEATKHHTLLYGPGGAIWAGMSRSAWDALPDDVKKIMEETTGEAMVKACGVTLDKADIADLKYLQEKGATVTNLEPAERERWRLALVKPYEDFWLEQARERTDTADAIMARYRELAAEAEKEFGIKL